MSVQFEWDAAKAASNLRKHGVAFEDAKSVFFDPLAAIFDDEENSVGESREIIVGHTTGGQLLLVSFTERNVETIRIISARRATRHERRDYEQGGPLRPR